MGFSMFSTHASPIAIDFGTSSVKLLQITGSDRPNIAAAAELTIPDEIRFEPNQLFTHFAAKLPKLLHAARFRGRRAIITVPSAQTFIQHMQLVSADGVKREDLIKAQLQQQMGCSPDSVVVRWVDVADVQRDGQARSEVICFAIARDTVMRYVELLRRCKVSVVGVHTTTLAMVRSFDHLHRRQSDADLTTLYVDLGWGGTSVAISHGKQVVFARCIQIGGRHFDQMIVSALGCDPTHARAHRLSLEGPVAQATGARMPETAQPAGAPDENTTTGGGPGPQTVADRNVSSATQADRRMGMIPAEFCAEVEPGEAPNRAANVDLTELLDTTADELSMCLRYHRGLFPDRSIDRTIFLGGEARQVWVCQHVVKSLRVPAQLGDPLARMSRDGTPPTPGLKLDEPQPGWAVACLA
jgi:Tfp pilus assembly PilM family ATPase